ncbi:MAG: methionine--tRNA ligase [Polyangiaceae bacterium]|nr:methionine--tRNA ligase [Polyangiaceae bacterium]
MTRRYYVTTPIYYINDVPHLGSAYTTIAADVIARYRKLRGFEVHFLTGTDEHGLKIQREAERRGIAPEVLADQMSAAFRQAWPALGCEPDDFIRTHEPRHVAGAQALWRKIRAAGDIYLGDYQGLYCVGCEAYYTDKELLPGGVCPLHKTAAEPVKEQSYFFRLSRYGERLLELYEKNPEFVSPPSRLNEVRSFVRQGLQDLSVSRTTFRWGIPVPDDDAHVMYVWFDALSNYLTALSAPVDHTRFWPPNVHLVGKDILRFHAVYWPAFLMAAGYPDDALPRQILAHGFLTYGGQKMSKSLRNTVSPLALAEGIAPWLGVDVIRYCLLRSISFGHDGDFSIEDVLGRYAADLGNTLGNLLHRLLPFASDAAARAAAEPAGPLEEALRSQVEVASRAAAEAFDGCAPTRALEAIWVALTAANSYVDRAAPWAARKQSPARLGTIVLTLAAALEAASVLVAPVMPRVAAALRQQLGLAPLVPRIGADQWPLDLPARDPGHAFAPGEPIFPRLDKERIAELRTRFAPPAEPAAPGGGPPGVDPAEPPPTRPSPARAAPAVKTPSRPRAAEAAAVAPAEAAPEPAVPTAAAPKAVLDFDSFAKIDLRVGVVRTAERIPKKDRVLSLTVDVGEAEPRRIVAGIAAHYAPEALVGRRVVVVANLAPRPFGGGLGSHGMLLASDTPAGVRLITPDDASPPGAPVR